jgi:hypothetical protein
MLDLLLSFAIDNSVACIWKITAYPPGSTCATIVAILTFVPMTLGHSAVSWYSTRQSSAQTGFNQDKTRFWERMKPSMVGRFMRTKKDYFCLAVDAKQRDYIAVVSSGRFPLVIRPVVTSPLDERLWELSNDAYVHGLMFGEAFSQGDGKTEEIWFV